MKVEKMIKLMLGRIKEEHAIVGSWKTVYPLKEEKNGKVDPIDYWADFLEEGEIL